jgi:PKD repeat protein
MSIVIGAVVLALALVGCDGGGSISATASTGGSGASPGAVAPTARFSAAATIGTAPLNVEFADESDPGSKPITDWFWDFGDGETSTEQDPVHTYEDIACYAVSLQVTTSVGSDTETMADYIDVVSTHMYLVKTDDQGNLVWERTYGGEYDQRAESVEQTADGGYVLAGSWLSVATGRDVYLVKVDSDGNVVWEYTYGDARHEVARSVAQTIDGGYILAGHTSTWEEGDPDGRIDVYLMKTDDQGNLEWEQTFGREDDEFAYSVQQTADGGYILGGFEYYSPDDEGKNMYLIKTDAVGNLEWEQTYGGVLDDQCRSLQVTADGGYVLAGFSASFWNQTPYMPTR